MGDKRPFVQLPKLIASPARCDAGHELARIRASLHASNYIVAHKPINLCGRINECARETMVEE
jgi:hypothetical protein